MDILINLSVLEKKFLHVTDSPHFSLLMWRNLSCGEIPPHNRFAWHFLFLMWRNLSCGKFLHMTDFSTFLHITHFAPHLSCGELSLCDRFSSHFSCGETSPHDNLSYGKFSPHDKFFLHNHRLWWLWQISGMHLWWKKVKEYFFTFDGRKLNISSPLMEESKGGQNECRPLCFFLHLLCPTKTPQINWQHSNINQIIASAFSLTLSA